MAYLKTATPPNDAEYVQAELSHLVAGTQAWMRDPRRTPVWICSVTPRTASFCVEVLDFEDKGATWVLPLWKVSDYLVLASSARAGCETVKDLNAATSKFNKTIRIDARVQDAAETHAEIAKLANQLADPIRAVFDDESVQVPAAHGQGMGQFSRLPQVLATVLDQFGILDLERSFARGFASNPNAGEQVNAHRMMLAQMGLVPYDGPVLRDLAALRAQASKADRRLHIVVRLAFHQALWRQLQLSHVALYRTIYHQTQLDPPRNQGFVSASFDPDVARMLFDDAHSVSFRRMMKADIPVERVFMTWLETPELSVKYQEAEAVLLFDPHSAAF